MRTSERGSAIIILFIMVALFGLLSFAFLRGSTSNIGWLQKEQTNAAATNTQDCTNVVNMAAKRLQLHGCGSLVSYNQDGSNDAVGAPTDGSCSIFHTNGGGAKPCGNLASCSAGAMTALSIGQACGNVVYAGVSGGRRIYAALADQGAYTYSSAPACRVTSATSQSDGLMNTNTLLAITGASTPYSGEEACRSLGAKWYVPAVDEMTLLYTNRNTGSLSGTLTAPNYWTSTEFISCDAFYVRFSDGIAPTWSKGSNTINVRCVRRD